MLEGMPLRPLNRGDAADDGDADWLGAAAALLLVVLSLPLLPLLPGSAGAPSAAA